MVFQQNNCTNILKHDLFIFLAKQIVSNKITIKNRKKFISSKILSIYQKIEIKKINFDILKLYFFFCSIKFFFRNNYNYFNYFCTDKKHKKVSISLYNFIRILEDVAERGVYLRGNLKRMLNSSYNVNNLGRYPARLDVVVDSFKFVRQKKNHLFFPQKKICLRKDIYNIPGVIQKFLCFITEDGLKNVSERILNDCLLKINLFLRSERVYENSKFIKNMCLLYDFNILHEFLYMLNRKKYIKIKDIKRTIQTFLIPTVEESKNRKNIIKANENIFKGQKIIYFKQFFINCIINKNKYKLVRINTQNSMMYTNYTNKFLLMSWRKIQNKTNFYKIYSKYNFIIQRNRQHGSYLYIACALSRLSPMAEIGKVVKSGLARPVPVPVTKTRRLFLAIKYLKFGVLCRYMLNPQCKYGFHFADEIREVFNGSRKAYSIRQISELDFNLEKYKENAYLLRGKG